MGHRPLHNQVAPEKQHNHQQSLLRRQRLHSTILGTKHSL